MKKIYLFIFLLFFTFSVFAQDTSYHPVLKDAILKSNQGYLSENFYELANACERIITVKPNDWLPYYYSGYAYINMSFIEKEPDEKEAFCKKAKTMINKTKELNPSESEVDVLEALLCYALMEISPMVSGPLNLPKANKALKRAQEKNPENPRSYYLKGKSTMYMPAFMGGGKEVAVPLFQKALELFDKYIPETEVHPSWGQSDAKSLLEKCQKASE